MNTITHKGKMFKKVNKKEFYDAFFHLDAVHSVIGNFPYTSHWKMRGKDDVIAISKDDYKDGMINHYPIVTKYYLPL